MSHRTKSLSMAIGLIPAIVTLYYVISYEVAVPVADDWELIVVLNSFATNSLSFEDLFAFHNEHRIFFPRVIMLAIAALSDWNLLYTQIASFVVALATFTLIISLTRGAEGNLPRAINPWLVFCLSATFFSLTQWENWTRAWQIQVFLANFFLLTVLYLLSRPRLPATRLVAAMAAAFAASFSFANGLLVWPTGLVVLLLRSKEPPNDKLRYGIAWCTVACLTAFFYFQGYQKPAAHPPLTAFLEHPVQFFQFVFLYLGHVVVYPHHRIVALGILTGIIGILGVTMFFIFSFMAIRMRLPSSNFFLPFIGMGVYALGSAVVTAVGRVGFNIQNALSSRYASFGLFLWIANLFFLSALSLFPLSHLVSPGVLLKIRRFAQAPTARFAVPVFLALITTSILLNSVSSTKKINYFHRYLNVAIPQMIAPGDSTLLLRIYPNQAVLSNYLALAKKYRFSVFRLTPDRAMNYVRKFASPILKAPAAACPSGPSLQVEVLDYSDTDSTVMIEGLSFFNGHELRPDSLFLVLAGDSASYWIPARPRINQIDANRGFFILALKHELPPAIYTSAICYRSRTTCANRYLTTNVVVPKRP